MDDLLEPQLLDLPEHLFDSSPQLLQHLFSVWLSLPRPAALVKALIDYVEYRNLISVPGSPLNASTVRSNLVSNAISLGVATPLSPNFGSSANLSTNESIIVATAVSLVIGHTHLPNTGSSANASNNERNLASEQKIRASSSSISLALAGDIKQEVIPQFYFPLGRPPTSELREECLNRINNLFNSKPYGLGRTEFRRVTKEVCKLPFFLSFALFQKIVVDSLLRVTRDAFIQYWVNGNMLTMDKETQVFNILKQPDRNYLTKADFLQVLGELCAFHRGFAFLKERPETQETYAATVIFRIFYYINRSGNGHITLRELKRGDLIAAMQHADEEEDINKVLRYFSYEHVIVIYLKFMELDTDNDMFIDKMDLARYNKHALSSRILDRIFSQVPRRFTSIIEGKMSYEDFVYFILAEEDKPSEPSLEYWFKCIDLDGNGILTRDELEYFYEEQIDRMQCIAEEEYVPFELMLHRILDMIAPEGKDGITLRDVKRSKLSGDFFNILFNLNKFLASEGPKWIKNHEEYLTGQEHLRENLTEWDWFALRECHKLLMEEKEVASDKVHSDKKSPAIEGRSETGLDLFDDKPQSKKKLRASEAPY